MTLDFFAIFGLITTVFTLVNAVLYLRGYSFENIAYKYFTLYVLMISFAEVLGLVLGKIFHVSNLFVSSLYMVLQFGLLSFFYASLLKSNWIKIICGVVLLILIGQFIAEPNVFLQYNPFGIIMTHLLLVAFAVIYFYRSLNKTKEFIIVNIGVFIYLLASALIFASGNLVLILDLSKNTGRALINVNRVLFFVFQVLICVEWYRNYRPKRVSRTSSLN